MELKLAPQHVTHTARGLLIVPYGIEITEPQELNQRKDLLIVPYGIEIANRKPFRILQPAFNRTLWN